MRSTSRVACADTLRVHPCSARHMPSMACAGRLRQSLLLLRQAAALPVEYQQAAESSIRRAKGVCFAAPFAPRMARRSPQGGVYGVPEKQLRFDRRLARPVCQQMHRETSSRPIIRASHLSRNRVSLAPIVCNNRGNHFYDHQTQGPWLYLHHHPPGRL
jgi:hypothetical protein